jgi:hypothetical protein
MAKHAVNTVTVKFQLEHLPVMVRALETYSRLKSGQIAAAFTESFGFNPRASRVERVVRKSYFPELESNTSYGVGMPELGDGTLAYGLRKVFAEYLHYKQNKGYRRLTDVDGDGCPPQIGGIPRAEIMGFNPVKKIAIPKKYQAEVTFLADREDWETLWVLVDHIFKHKKIPKGSKTQLELADKWYVIVTHPQKN